MQSFVLAKRDTDGRGLGQPNLCFLERSQYKRVPLLSKSGGSGTGEGRRAGQGEERPEHVRRKAAQEQGQGGGGVLEPSEDRPEGRVTGERCGGAQPRLWWSGEAAGKKRKGEEGCATLGSSGNTQMEKPRRNQR